ncbi:MAG TPA: methyltransferase domain-containing protein, partial [Acidimicrobiales bacterium]|nr:methyltransferase domain-containing protein [Acidimicrobiales bacterium]
DATSRVWRALRRLDEATPHGQAAEHEQFLQAAYRRLLDREIDEVGLRSNLWRLANGTPEAEIVMEIAESPEYAGIVLAGRELRVPGHEGIEDLTELRPEAYQLSVDVARRRMLTYVAKSSEDYDWLEDQIIAHDYYERPGVWILEIDLDKQVMAELISRLEPATVLELGCSSGAVITGLVGYGIDAEGVDISASSKALAAPEIQPRIHVGDLLDIELDRRYDVVMGLDVFEHLNPNKLDGYLGALVDRMAERALLFANIPAYGDDEVFGIVNPIVLAEWQDAPGGLFDLLPVDEAGYPLHGHLIWATTGWWCERFERAGLRREPELERALHAVYDAYFRTTSRARESFYVFSKQGDADAVHALAERAGSQRSSVLAGFSAEAT